MTEPEAPRYTVEEFLAQRDLLKQDLRTAAEVQNAMLPKFPPIRYAAASIIYQPAAEVSGDVYDFILNREGELGVFVGDATGHGVAAALITMMIHLGLDTIRRDLPTDEILRRLNRLLAARATGRSVSAVMFRITQAGRLTITHAAHPTVIVIPARGGPFREFTQAGCALGHFADEPVPYEEESVQLQPGDRVLAYTDGVVEWRNAEGEPFHGGRHSPGVQDVLAHVLSVIDAAEHEVRSLRHQRLDPDHHAVRGSPVDLPAPVAALHWSDRVVQRERMTHGALFSIGSHHPHLAERLAPSAVVAAGTARGNEVLAHAAAILDQPFAANCIDVAGVHM